MDANSNSGLAGAVFIPEADMDKVLETANQIREDDASSRTVIARETVDEAPGTQR